jgi:hypothetical protein
MLRAKAKFTVDCREVANVHDIRTDTSFQAKTNAKVPSRTIHEGSKIMSDCECFLRGFWLRYPECKKLCRKLGEQTR